MVSQTALVRNRGTTRTHRMLKGLLQYISARQLSLVSHFWHHRSCRYVFIVIFGTYEQIAWSPLLEHAGGCWVGGAKREKAEIQIQGSSGTDRAKAEVGYFCSLNRAPHWEGVLTRWLWRVDHFSGLCRSGPEDTCSILYCSNIL